MYADLFSNLNTSNNDLRDHDVKTLISDSSKEEVCRNEPICVGLIQDESKYDICIEYISYPLNNCKDSHQFHKFQEKVVAFDDYHDFNDIELVPT